MRFTLLAGVLALSACAHQPQAAQSCAHETTTREARFTNGDIALAGAWITPLGVARAPAVVLLQGSGESDRSNQWAASVAEALAQCGVAVLLTDKRGSGASGGDWETASMLELAADGVAALNWISEQPGVDTRRIGFLGLSQGGKVAPAAATLSGQADFAIGWVTSVEPMRQGLFYELEQTYRQHGLDDAQIDYLERLHHAAFRWLETGEGWSDYLAIRDEILRTPLARGADSWPERQDDAYWTFWRVNGGYAALPYWREIAEQRRLPSLVILGELDAADNVDVDTTTRLLRDVRGAMHVEVIPGVGHSLMTESGTLHPRAVELTVDLILESGSR